MGTIYDKVSRHQAIKNVIGTDAPEMDLVELKNKDKKITIKALVSKAKLPMVLEFYMKTSYGAPCGPVEEHLDTLAGDEKYKGKVSFVICSVHDDVDKADQFAKQHKLSNAMLCVANPKDVEQCFKVGKDTIPHRVLINAAGKVVMNGRAPLIEDIKNELDD